MADSSNGKELSMEMRLLLAFILMGAVLFLWQYLNPAPIPPPAPTTPASTEAPAAQEEKVAPEEPEEHQAPPAEVPGAVSAQAEEQHTIDTDVFKVVFSNRGAVVRSWVLKGFEDGAGGPLELVNGADHGSDASVPQAVKDSVTALREQVGYPFSLRFVEAVDLGFQPNDQLFVMNPSADGLGVEFEFSDGKTLVRKSFGFSRDSYRVEFSSEVVRGASSVPHLLVWRGGFGDSKVETATTDLRSLYYDPVAEDLTTVDSGDVEDSPVVTGRYSFAGLEDKYFTAVAIPGNGSSFDLHMFTDSAAVGPEAEEQLHVGVAIGGRGNNTFPLYVGPKDIDLLEETDPRLAQLVDFGFFSILAKPLFVVLKWIHDNWVANYGWSIVIITFAINFLTLPLKFTSLKSMRKMQAIQPLIKELNEKYKGVGMRDPKKSQQNEEMMALYKKHGVNPMGGCMPMVLQIPFFFAFYTVLTVAIELRGADWLWVRDLSQPEHLAIRVLPIVMVISQFAMQKMTPSTTPDPNQQRIMMLMPLMFGFFFYSVSSGLVLYWLTSNLVGVAQQLVFNKLISADIPPEPGPAAKPKRRRPKSR